MPDSDDSDNDSVSLLGIIRANPLENVGGGGERGRSRSRLSGDGERHRSPAQSPSPERQRVRRSPSRPVEREDGPAIPAAAVPAGAEPAVDRGNFKGRHFVFTWNNYPVDAPQRLSAMGSTFLAYQPERGESGTRHLQGIIMQHIVTVG